MGRVSARKAAQLRARWAENIAGIPRGSQTTRVEEEPGRGVDYSGADNRWVCNRKKSYGARWLAERVAMRMNETNQTDDARPGFRGVVVVPYLCRRCGEYHIGR